jgi:hypothetical protein
LLWEQGRRIALPSVDRLTAAHQSLRPCSRAHSRLSRIVRRSPRRPLRDSRAQANEDVGDALGTAVTGPRCDQNDSVAILLPARLTRKWVSSSHC